MTMRMRKRIDRGLSAARVQAILGFHATQTLKARTHDKIIVINNKLSYHKTLNINVDLYKFSYQDNRYRDHLVVL